MRFPPLSALALSAVLLPNAHAWGAVGHEIVATIAQMYLHPTVMPMLCGILDVADASECHLAPVAAWADSVRKQSKYRWTSPLHYIGATDDHPGEICLFPGPNGWQGRTHINVLNAVRNTTSVLQEFEALRRAGDHSEVPYYVQDALKFLIHFVGDMHQPLHLTSRGRGGNADKVAFEGHTTNLHSVWDSRLISERLRTLSHNYTTPLPLPEVESHLRDTIYDAYIRRVVWEGLLGKWQDDLDDWLRCPSTSTSSATVRPSQPQPQPRQASVSQAVLSLVSPVAGRVRGSGLSDGDNGLPGVDDDRLCPHAWATPIHRLNCQIVYPDELDELAPSSATSSELGTTGGEDGLTSKYVELYTPSYVGVIKEQWIVEKLLAQAGIRLAAVLNWIFAQVDDGEEITTTRHLSL